MTDKELEYKDTLSNLEHIDTIIDQIVRDGIVILTGILAVIASLFIFLSQHSQNFLFSLTILVCIMGMGICITLILNLSRQEQIRQWYLYHLKKYEINTNNTLLPSPNWCPDNKAMENWVWLKKIIVCKISPFGAKWGYCVLWVTLFLLLVVVFVSMIFFSILCLLGKISY